MNVKYEVRILAATKAGYPTLADDKWPWMSQSDDELCECTICLCVFVIMLIQYIR